MKEEIWKPVVGFEGRYEVSNLGNVRSLNYRNTGKTKERKIVTNNMGYFLVTLGRYDRFLVHRLVAQAFIPNPDNLPCVNHKNRIRTDNRCENLEFCTVAYNNKYSDVCGRGRKPVIKYTKEGVFVEEFESTQEASRQTGLSQGNIYSCCVGRRNHTGGFIFKFKEDI